MTRFTWTLAVTRRLGFAAMLAVAPGLGCGQAHVARGACEPDDCGLPPEVAPRRCDDGSLVGPDVQCVAEEDMSCGWSIVAPPVCPEDATDGGEDATDGGMARACEPDDCGLPPEVVPRQCDDGSLVGPDVQCVAEEDMSCGWSIVAPAVCPEDATDAGTP